MFVIWDGNCGTAVAFVSQKVDVWEYLFLKFSGPKWL